MSLKLTKAVSTQSAKPSRAETERPTVSKLRSLVEGRAANAMRRFSRTARNCLNKLFKQIPLFTAGRGRKKYVPTEARASFPTVQTAKRSDLPFPRNKFPKSRLPLVGCSRNPLFTKFRAPGRRHGASERLETPDARRRADGERDANVFDAAAKLFKQIV